MKNATTSLLLRQSSFERRAGLFPSLKQIKPVNTMLRHLLPHGLILLLLAFGFTTDAGAQERLLQTRGTLSFLRVHDVGTGYGPRADHIDVEVVIKFRGRDNDAFGFQLRNDANGRARQGMLDLLRDAFSNGNTVTIDYNIVPGKRNGRIMRAWLTR